MILFVIVIVGLVTVAGLQIWKEIARENKRLARNLQIVVIIITCLLAIAKAIADYAGKNGAQTGKSQTAAKSPAPSAVASPKQAPVDDSTPFDLGRAKAAIQGARIKATTDAEKARVEQLEKAASALTHLSPIFDYAIIRFTDELWRLARQNGDEVVSDYRSSKSNERCCGCGKVNPSPPFSVRDLELAHSKRKNAYFPRSQIGYTPSTNSKPYDSISSRSYVLTLIDSLP